MDPNDLPEIGPVEVRMHDYAAVRVGGRAYAITTDWGGKVGIEEMDGTAEALMLAHGGHVANVEPLLVGPVGNGCPVVLHAGGVVTVNGVEITGIPAAAFAVLAAMVEVFPDGLPRRELDRRSGKDARKALARVTSAKWPALAAVLHYEKGVKGRPGLHSIRSPS